MKIRFTPSKMPGSGAYVLFGFEGEEPGSIAQIIGATALNQLERAVKAGGYQGKAGERVRLTAPAGTDVDHLILMGLGKREELSPLAVEQTGGKLTAELAELKVKEVVVELDGLNLAGSELCEATFAARIACGIKLRNYRFTRYQTEAQKENAADRKVSLESLTLSTQALPEAEEIFNALDARVKGTLLARDLVSEPGNVLHPESYAERIEQLNLSGLEVEVLDEDAMAALGMQALLSVGRGSARQSRLVIMQWRGADNPAEAPLAFVGKGVTFDSGGISIKPAAGMEDMKFDMAGSAAVVGLMTALANRNAPVNAVGVVGLVENMPSSTASRPGDVVTSMAGKTIEILNTDAEGRLVLADALWYTQDRFKPRVMINLATLTGAIMGALGQEHAGLFSNNDSLCEQLTAAGLISGEKLWRFPMGEAYAKLIKSDIADLKNLGGPYAGSITAAQFLEPFANDVPWAHLDIAGMAWHKEATDIADKGASGFGVRLLDQWVKEYHEVTRS